MPDRRVVKVVLGSQPRRDGTNEKESTHPVLAQEDEQVFDIHLLVSVSVCLLARGFLAAAAAAAAAASAADALQVVLGEALGASECKDVTGGAAVLPAVVARDGATADVVLVTLDCELGAERAPGAASLLVVGVGKLSVFAWERPAVNGSKLAADTRRDTTAGKSSLADNLALVTANTSQRALLRIVRVGDLCVFAGASGLAAHEARVVASRALPRVRVGRQVAEGVAATLDLGGVVAEASPVFGDVGPAGREPTVDAAVARVRDVGMLANVQRLLIVLAVAWVLADRLHRVSLAALDHQVGVLA